MSSLLLLGAGTDKGASGGYTNAETTAWANAVATAGGSVTATEGGYVDTLVSALKSAESITSLSQKFDRIVLLVTADTDVHQVQIDLVTAGTAFTFHTSAADTFAGQWGHLTGYAGVVANSDYLDTGYAPSAGTQFTLNAAHMSACVLTSRTTIANYVAAGASNPGDAHIVYIQPLNTGPKTFFDVNGDTYSSSSQSNAKGVWTANRAASGTLGFYLNGSAVVGSPFTDASTLVTTASVAIGALNNGGTPDSFSSDAIAYWHIGGTLSSPSSVYTAFHNYMVSVGVASPP